MFLLMIFPAPPFSLCHDGIDGLTTPLFLPHHDSSPGLRPPSAPLRQSIPYKPGPSVLDIGSSRTAFLVCPLRCGSPFNDKFFLRLPPSRVSLCAFVLSILRDDTSYLLSSLARRRRFFFLTLLVRIPPSLNVAFRAAVSLPSFYPPEHRFEDFKAGSHLPFENFFLERPSVAGPSIESRIGLSPIGGESCFFFFLTFF